MKNKFKSSSAIYNKGKKENDEDIHTANERRLREIIGDVAMVI